MEGRRSLFPAEISVDAAAHEIELNLEMSENAGDTWIPEVQRMIDALALAMKAGMFSDDPTVVRPTSVPVVSTVARAPRGVAYLWTPHGIQLGVYRILLNMLMKYHYTSQPFESVRLTSAAAGGRRLNGPVILAEPYPTTKVAVPFDLNVTDDLADIKQPTIRFVFQKTITDEQLEALIPTLVAWDTLNGLGGYLEAFGDRYSQNLPWSQETHLAAPDTVEHTFFGMVGPPAAFGALINLAIRLHYTFCPLSGFEVE